MSDQIYECHNPVCVLGTAKTKGRFTGGITAEYKTMVTGEPLEVITDLDEYGEGWCPNCGQQGTEVDDG